MEKPIHIGSRIQEILEERHVTKKDLGLDIGLSPSSAAYLTSRETMDVRTLWKIGNILKYNFFKHYPVDEGEGTGGAGQDEKDKLIAELKAKVAELTQQLEAQKKENAYLNKINELLERKK